MNIEKILNKYYPEENGLKKILVTHSLSVTEKALQIAASHPELNIDAEFVREASMLHDIGIFRCDAPGIECYGTEPYICHGSIGSSLLEAEGLHRHALVCERHTGAGITLENIVNNNLPIPHRPMVPVSIEEQLICFADKFFSKSHLEVEKTVEQAERSLYKFGDDGVERFRHWCRIFL